MHKRGPPAPQITPQNYQDANGPKISETELKDTRVTRAQTKQKSITPMEKDQDASKTQWARKACARWDLKTQIYQKIDENH